MSEPSVDKIKLQFLGLVCVKEEVQCVGQLTPVSPTLSFYGLNFKLYDFFLLVVGLLCKKLLFCVPELCSRVLWASKTDRGPEPKTKKKQEPAV